MAKPDPALLDPARYPFYCEIATRFGDLDTNRHLNNVALVGIIEDGRVRFYHASGFGAETARINVMVASFTIEYLGEAWYPQPLAVHGAVARVGRTSIVLQQLVRQEDRIVAFAESTVVCVVGDRPAPIPAHFAKGVANWMLLP